jgi:hypothetical protein
LEYGVIFPLPRVTDFPNNRLMQYVRDSIIENKMHIHNALKPLIQRHGNI